MPVAVIQARGALAPSQGVPANALLLNGQQITLAAQPITLTKAA